MVDFPTGLPDIPDAVGTNPLSTFHTSESHSEATNRLIDNVLALATKLGYGSSSPGGSAAILKRLASGTSTWGTLDTAEVTAGAITGSGYTQATSAVDVSSTSYTNLMTLNYTSAGGDLLVIGADTQYLSSGSPTSWYVSLRVDSGSDLDLGVRSLSEGTGQLSAIRRFTGVSSGAHTIALRGTYAGGSGTVQSFWRSLMVLEIKR